METDDKLTAKPAAAAGAMPARKTKAYRDRLLTRLPSLTAPAWDARDVSDVHASMADLRDLGADTFLEPLARFAETRGE
jgi:hypothetical protein